MTGDLLKAAGWYRAGFELLEKSLNGEAASPVHRVRRAALARFEELGFPTTRDEEWRFTNISPIAETPFRPVTGLPQDLPGEEMIAALSVDRPAARLVFLDGLFVASLSKTAGLPAGVLAGSLRETLDGEPALVSRHLSRNVPFDANAFTALNMAFLQDGAFVRVPDGLQLEGPVHLLFVASGDGPPSLLTPRNLIIAGRDSRVAVVESYVHLAPNTYLTDVITEFVVEAGAVIEHDKLQTESPNAYHVGLTHICQAEQSLVTSNSVSIGGRIVRNNVTTVFGGEHAECTLNGLSVAAGSQLIDNHTTIDHAKPNCNSFEVYKAILDGSSRGVFNGKIFVRKDAQKTDAKQTNKTLLLSDEATIDTKPQLEIFADDVKCTHGATVGQLDEEQVFYLRSRGVDLTTARDILTFAFASDVIERIHVEALRERLEHLLHDRLRLGRVTDRDVQ
jgi:Fe-S cluster assembly protein SufD